MRQIKFGIFGLGRGGSFYRDILANNGDIVAVCDRSEEKLEEAKQFLGKDLATYKDFDSFIAHEGLEAVFLCNYFHEHAEYAIKALERDIHVLSECTSNSTMAEGVALVRAAEKSKAFYMLAENYPYMLFNQEMHRIYQGGSLGKCLFAEGEYNHPAHPYHLNDAKMLRPYANHWRNLTPRTYYITHSLSPLMYITGATPVRVSAFASFMPYPEDSYAGLYVADRAAIITCLNDDNSVFRVTGCAAFGAHGNSYRICGDKGQIENLRGYARRISLRYNSWDAPEGRENKIKVYDMEWEDEQKELIEQSGHDGSDFVLIREFFRCIRENERPQFDEYFATVQASVAILAHRSILANGQPFDVPDFHREEDRVKYENDTQSPFYGKDGSAPTMPCCSQPDFKSSPERLAWYDRVMSETDEQKYDLTMKQ